MSEPIKRPKRKNPILKTRAPTLPPDRRSRVALGLVRGAALGRLELQCCAACGAVQYPPREACVKCLSAELEWTAMSGRGELVSETTLRHSQELFFRERMPWRLGLVRLAEGVSLVAHLDSRLRSRAVSRRRRSRTRPCRPGRAGRKAGQRCSARR